MSAVSYWKISSKFRLAEKQKRCPECGARMVQADKRIENGSLFIWYECSSEDCNGQWLQQVAAPLPNKMDIK